MSTEEMLLGWLVITRYQEEDENSHTIDFSLPEAVTEEWINRGWAERRDPDWDQVEVIRITTAGRAAADLAAPEWLVNPIRSCRHEGNPDG